MAKPRNLLSIGNRKLGETVGHFDLPAVVSCPGRTPACVAACYARKHRFRFDSVVDRLAWCYEQSQLPRFARRLIRETRRRGILHFRWHSSGDVYNADYARKMLAVMRALTRVRFWVYTRSFRVPEILPLLAEMALLPNCKVWFSLDRDTGVPATRPPHVRFAFMQDSPEGVENVELIFRTKAMLSLPLVQRVCPADTPHGRREETTCGGCGFCFDD